MEVKLTLEAARVNAGLTQAQAAEKLGVDASTIGNWERGKTSPSFKYILDMSDLYGIPVSNFFLPRDFAKSETEEET